MYLTTLLTVELGLGPTAVASAVPPDMNSFNNRACHTIPLWRNSAATQPNLPAGLLASLNGVLGHVTAEDFFAYVYAVLSTPSYVETFWEELFVPGPRVPITRNAGIFGRSSALGRRLLWLHTYGERFVPDGFRHGQVSGGRTRCTRGIPTTAEDYPETVLWEADVLRVGDGEFSPVSKTVWEFSVSDFFVVQSWIRSRLRDGAGRRSSALDEIRPATWTAEMMEQLLELLWVVEATIDAQPELNATLSEILAGPLFTAAELPQPSEEERRPPIVEEEERHEEMILE